MNKYDDKAAGLKEMPADRKPEKDKSKDIHRRTSVSNPANRHYTDRKSKQKDDIYQANRSTEIIGPTLSSRILSNTLCDQSRLMMGRFTPNPNPPPGRMGSKTSLPPRPSEPPIRPPGNQQKSSFYQPVCGTSHYGLIPLKKKPEPARATTECPQRLEGILRERHLKIERQIGVGNYAIVYLVRYEKHNHRQYLAIKVIDLSRASINYQFRFLPRECKIIKAINHPNIVKFHYTLTGPDMFVFVMEYAEKGSLADYLANYRTGIPEQEVHKLYLPILDAINYLHRLNIAHRDLKLENILLDRARIPKLTDFSYATFCKADSSGQTALTATFCGSFPYMSPEVLEARHAPYHPKLADMWSLGVCLFILLNNRLPFSCVNIPDMLRAHRDRDYKFRSTVVITNECSDLVKRLLEPNYRQRLSVTQVLRHPWLKRF